MASVKQVKPDKNTQNNAPVVDFGSKKINL